EQGIILALVLSVILHVKRHYTTKDSVVSWNDDGEPDQHAPTPGTQSEPGLVVYRFSVGVFYANAARLMEEATALVDVPEPPRWVVLLADAIDDIDYTGGQTVAELAEAMAQRGIVFGIADASDDVLRELDRFGVIDKIGSEHVYRTLAEVDEAF